jgi:hypothetical protein
MKKIILKSRFFLLTLLMLCSSRAYSQQVVRGHLPAAISKLGLHPLGRLDTTRHLRLAIGLPLRNQQRLTTLLRDMYDPASPNFRHYLTTEQFTDQFGPTQQDYQAVIDFAKANGLKVVDTSPNRMMVQVSGTVPEVEKAFHVKMNSYQHPTEKRTFFAPDAEPTIPSGLSILDVAGLNSYSRPRPALRSSPSGRHSPDRPASGFYSGPHSGNDFRAAYAQDVTLNGHGQYVGIVAFSVYDPNDITQYENSVGIIPQLTPQNILLDGADGSTTTHTGNTLVVDEEEVTLDIEMAISMAPNLSGVLVYELPDTSQLSLYGWHILLNRMANDNLAKQLSCSWWMAGTDYDPYADQIFQQMAVQGQSFFNACGDDGAYPLDEDVGFPDGSPWVTEVGGTILYTDASGGPWSDEEVWSMYDAVKQTWSGTGGGPSTEYTLPQYQQGINGANGASTTMRNIPDVAMVANRFEYYFGGAFTESSGSGTSFSAPLWAGFTALINQQAVANGYPTVGFLNPVLYYIGRNPTNYAADFHDITVGQNTDNEGLYYRAGPGYDLCTGLGSPNGQTFINDIISVSLTSFNATVDQRLQGGSTSVGNIARYETNQFNSYPAGTGFTFYTGRPELLRGAQYTISGQRYNNWNSLSDVTNHHVFPISSTGDNYFLSNLVQVNNATVEALFEGVTPCGYVNFKDPWRIDTTDHFGQRNQGMLDWARQVNYSQNNVGLGSPDSGVFLNQGFNQGQWTPPYYSVSAPATQSATVNGRSATGVFQNWTGTNATFDTATNLSARVVFTGSGATVAAVYKGIHISNDGSAFTSNSQRKFVETPDGIMWQTYTSVINGVSHVFLEYAPNGSGAWQIMKTNSGSSWLDWAGQGKCPSLDWWDTGGGYYMVTVVFQSPSSYGKYEIDYVTFIRQPSSGAYQSDSRGQGPIYIEPSNGDSYSVNANPAIAFGPGTGSQPSFVVAFERKSLSNSGINLKWGYMSYPGLSVTGGTSNSQRVTNTNASSCNPTICSERTAGVPYFDLAYEQDVSQYSSTIQYRLLSLTTPGFYYCNEIESRPLSNSSYMINIRPCITVMNGDWYASWLSQANPSVAAKCAYTNLNTGTIYYYGISVSSTSINVSNDNSCCYVAWNDLYSNANQLVNTANPGALANLNTKGPDIQMSNGPSHNTMYVSSYYRSSSPYYWLTSFRLAAAGLGKGNPVAVASGRGCTINNGDANFLYTFGDLNVDGQNVEFVDVPDSIKFTSIDSINSFLLTQPFNLSKTSKVVFTEMSGFADSSVSISVLGKRAFVGYRVELINDGTNKVMGTLKNVSLTASNLHSTGMTCYSLDTRKIKNGTYRIKITVNTNQDSAKFSLVEQRALENLATGASAQSLALQSIDVITDYALGQNYPNPFNPSTMINYQLPADGHVTLKVYDVLGREVETLVNENQQVGRYSVNFDGSRLASGVYFYRLNVVPTNGKTYESVKKMLMIK